jgi:hypothetical protein
MPRKPVDFAKAEEETTQPAQEVIAHLYKALLKMEPFTLLDGTPVRVEAYQLPEINDAGEAQCGVDVKLPNGHLEFTMRNTGWGKAFTKAISPHSKSTNRQR